MFKFLAVVILLSSVISYSQVNQEWVSRYTQAGNYDDEAVSITVDAAGNVYVTGYSDGSGTGEDYATIKYNSSGAQQWLVRYNGPGNYLDLPTSIAVDGSGNVYVTGGSYSGADYTTEDYATIKYNSAGVQQWAVRYNGPGDNEDGAYSIAVDPQGNVYVTGTSWGTSTSLDYATIKYNSAGVQQWVARYDGPFNDFDFPRSLVIDNSGNVYVTGFSSQGLNNYDYATVKYNSSGVQQWATRYNGPGNNNDIARKIAIDIFGNVYVTGSSLSGANDTTSDFATIKYNSSGVQQWASRYNGPGNSTDQGYAIGLDAAGNIYVTGYSVGSGTGRDYATLKYNSAGVQQWVSRYDGGVNADDQAVALAIDTSGNIYVTGWISVTQSATGNNYGTIKYNSSGVQQWFISYNGTGDNQDYANAIAVDSSGNVYVTGASVGSGTNLDFATIKYSQPIGIQQISSEIPKDFSLSQNYPNPFNPNSKIKFQISKNSATSLVVFDVLGREVSTLVNQQLKPGTYEVDFDGSRFSSGVYFYKLSTANYTETKKMLLVK
jgi:uncharacterized delta-60 repeat protein